MIFTNKHGKPNSFKLSDKRKISLLNVNYKICTGVEAARLRKTMKRSISQSQFVGGSDRRITHAINMARDAICVASTRNNEGSGILDTDLKNAFDNMFIPWCLMVLKRKGLPDVTIKRFFNLYTNNFSRVVVNGISGRNIENKHLLIRQGDKNAMELFSYGIDPIIDYLEKRLEGITIYSMPRIGPALQQEQQQLMMDSMNTDMNTTDVYCTDPRCWRTENSGIPPRPSQP